VVFDEVETSYSVPVCRRCYFECLREPDKISTLVRGGFPESAGRFLKFPRLPFMIRVACLKDRCKGSFEGSEQSSLFGKKVSRGRCYGIRNIGIPSVVILALFGSTEYHIDNSSI
jgi:hypothetical protein